MLLYYYSAMHYQIVSQAETAKVSHFLGLVPRREPNKSISLSWEQYIF